MANGKPKVVAVPGSVPRFARPMESKANDAPDQSSGYALGREKTRSREIER